MSDAPNDGTAAAALGAHSKDAPAASRAGAQRGYGIDALDDFMTSASKLACQASDEVSEVVHERPVTALFVAGALGMLLGLVLARRR